MSHTKSGNTRNNKFGSMHSVSLFSNYVNSTHHKKVNASWPFLAIASWPLLWWSGVHSECVHYNAELIANVSVWHVTCFTGSYLFCVYVCYPYGTSVWHSYVEVNPPTEAKNKTGP